MSAFANLTPRNLSSTCHDTWDALPSHLKYNKECWKSLGPDVCFMLGKLYLAYLFVDLLIYQMIGVKIGSVDPCLVQISIQTLETVVQMCNSRDRVGFSPRDLSGLVRTSRVLCIITHNLLELTRAA